MSGANRAKLPRAHPPQEVPQSAFGGDTAHLRKTSRMTAQAGATVSLTAPVVRRLEGLRSRGKRGKLG